MPQEPKKRHSRGRQGKRRTAIKLTAQTTVRCTNCGQPTLPHSICRNCGYYKGVEVLHIETKEEREKRKTAKNGQESK